MTFVITRSCCNDASCVAVCPVDCIHPTPDEPDFGTTEMLYIDPSSCIDCGACVDHCPVSAIAPDYDLRADQAPFLELNAAWFEEPGRRDLVKTPTAPPTWAWNVIEGAPLRVAVVGSGPAAFYVAEEILGQRGLRATVDMIERLDTHGGLVRFGVAPDHQDTRDIARTFARTTRRDGFRLVLNTQVGTDVTINELAQRYHAVVLATGAPMARPLGIAGEDLSGSHTAREFVAWYNGHPDHTGSTFDLSAERAVVIGNGNVALDVARILASDVDRLSTTSIASHALEQLRESNVHEVVIVGRRGPSEAAFSAKELSQLTTSPDVQVAAVLDEIRDARSSDPVGRFKMNLLRTAACDSDRPSDQRVSLRFNLTPTEIVGDSRVQSVRFRRTDLLPHDEFEEFECGLVLRAIGYLGRAIPGVPFDEATGTIPSDGGRVLDSATGRSLPGLYVSGWIKRGPRGVIGSNKVDARQTVGALLDDYSSGRLRDPALLEDVWD